MNVMEKIKALMDEVQVGFLATCDGEKAAARPMGAWLWDGADLVCATFKASDKIAEIEKCPKGEYCFMDKQMNHVRVAGPISIENRTL